MSRFKNLEFEGGSEKETRAEATTKDEQYYLARAQAAFETADFDAALREYSKVLEFNPRSVPAWAGQVRALIELGEWREAKLWADKALEHLPQEPELLAAKAVTLARVGDLDAALAFSDAAIEERGNTAYVWLARGDVLLARQESRAEYCFERALLLSPREWIVAWLAARIRFFYRQFAAALRLVERALEWEAAAPVLWLQRGLCQQQLGLIDRARHSFSQAIELNAFCRPAHQALAALDHVSVWTRWANCWRSLFVR